MEDYHKEKKYGKVERSGLVTDFLNLCPPLLKYNLAPPLIVGASIQYEQNFMLRGRILYLIIHRTKNEMKLDRCKILTPK